MLYSCSSYPQLFHTTTLQLGVACLPVIMMDSKIEALLYELLIDECYLTIQCIHKQQQGRWCIAN